jgi:hypothetical protein
VQGIQVQPVEEYVMIWSNDPTVTEYRYIVLQVAFVRELGARLPSPTPLVITAVNPGLCHSSLQRELDKYCLLRMVLGFVKWLLRARTSEMGSRNLVYAALATNAQDLHGRYMSSCEVVEECDFLLSAEGRAFSERLWVSFLASDSSMQNLEHIHRGRLSKFYRK